MGGKAAVPGRGRKPKPKKTNRSSPPAIKFSDAVDIDPPSYMQNMPYATVIWRSVVPELLENEVLQITDMHNVEIFCTAYETYRQAQEELSKTGVTLKTEAGSVIKNPALTALNEATRQMATFGSMLGLDPSSRARIMGAANKEIENQFTGVLNM